MNLDARYPPVPGKVHLQRVRGHWLAYHTTRVSPEDVRVNGRWCRIQNERAARAGRTS